MTGYELHDHRRKTDFRSLDVHFANFSSSVNRISEEIFSQQAVCMSILREVRELKRANEILRKASAYFAQAEGVRQPSLRRPK